MTAGHATAGMYRPRRLHGFPHGLPDLWCGRIPEHLCLIHRFCDVFVVRHAGLLRSKRRLTCCCGDGAGQEISLRTDPPRCRNSPGPCNG